MEELADAEVAEESEHELVYSWQVEQLATLGLSSVVASAIAGVASV